MTEVGDGYGLLRRGGVEVGDRESGMRGKLLHNTNPAHSIFGTIDIPDLLI